MSPARSACTSCQTCPPGYAWGDSCTTTSDAQCTQCAVGEYNPGGQVTSCLRCEGGKYQITQAATTCLNCLACPTGKYAKFGCSVDMDTICANCFDCSLMGYETARACTSRVDTICAAPTSCLDTRTLPAYNWIGEEQRCQKGQYLIGFNASGETRTCGQCPPGWAGLNGVFCERCKALEEPYFLDRSSCVCKSPAVMNASGGCVCPDGYRQQGVACVACGANTRGIGGLCVACGAGNFSLPAATKCETCVDGKYRLASQAVCQNCTPVSSGWYAPDPALAMCVKCNTTCKAKGWYRAGDCPGDASGRYSVCLPCPGGLPGNATWRASNATECAFDCLTGFYHSDGRCQRCTNRTCEAGQRLTACAPSADSHCDVECEDPDKPAFHSHWEKGENCPWACDAGYGLVVWDYVLFNLRECAPTR
jgi:hypothetical protein